MIFARARLALHKLYFTDAHGVQWVEVVPFYRDSKFSRRELRRDLERLSAEGCTGFQLVKYN